MISVGNFPVACSITAGNDYLFHPCNFRDRSLGWAEIQQFFLVGSHGHVHRVCVCICAFVHLCMCAFVHLCICAGVHVCMCACVCACMFACMCARMRTCMHECMCACRCACICMYVHQCMFGDASGPTMTKGAATCDKRWEFPCRLQHYCWK